MIIGERLRQLREEKDLTHGDVQERTGLLRCYISRVENGYTVPSIPTLEKMARALEVPMYRLFHDGEVAGPPPAANRADRERTKKEMKMADKFRKFLRHTTEYDRQLLVTTARTMAKAANRRMDEGNGGRERKRGRGRTKA